MPVESATYVADLQPVNPPSTDPRSQGDDHLRLIKQVLQNTFQGASRAWQVPGALTTSTSLVLTKANGESVIYCSTAGGAINITLPALVAGDAGWKVRICKTSSDANPVFILPPSGTLSSGGVTGLAKARRCIPGIDVRAIWDGAAWFVTRAIALPIGSMIDYSGASFPAGYEWPSGTALSSATNYPEYNAVTGSLATPDMRGRLGIPLDNLGGVAAGRLPSGFISGSVLGSTGGADANTLVTGNLPAYTPAGTITNGAITVSLSPAVQVVAGGGAYCPGGGTFGNPTTLSASASQAASTFAGTAQGGSSTPFSNLQPSVMITKLLVVE